MTTVFVLSEWYSYEWSVKGVFSTIERAEAVGSEITDKPGEWRWDRGVRSYVDTREEEEDHHWMEIHEWTVDGLRLT